MCSIYSFEGQRIIMMRAELKELIETNNEQSNEKVKELIKDADIYTLLYPHGENLLHWAAAFDNATIAEYLLKEKNFHPNVENYRGTCPLFYGCMQNAEAAVPILLKYHAQPRISSGFSGEFPIETTSSHLLREKLKVDTPANYYKAYKYRCYMYWRMSLNHFVSNGNSNAQGVVIEPKAEQIVKESGVSALGDECTRLLLDYVNCSNEPNANLGQVCLICGNNEDIQQCPRCNTVWFCKTKCDQIGHRLHDYDCPNMTIGKFFVSSSLY